MQTGRCGHRPLRALSSFLLALALLFSLAACKSGADTAQTGPAVYRAVSAVNAGSDLIRPTYLNPPEGADPLALMAQAVSAAPDQPGQNPVLPAGVTLLSYSLNERELDLELSAGYLALSDMDKTLCDACLALSFCSVPGIDSVSVKVNGAVQTAGLTASDVLLYDTEENPYERQLRLYFVSGDFLSLEYHTLSVDKGEGLERYVMEELLRGPYSGSLKSAIPAGTQLIGEPTVDNGICTVNLSGAFVTNKPDSLLGEHLALYSIVDSLTSLSEVDSVSFQIEGTPLLSYGSHSLSAPLKRDNSALGPANTAKGEVNISIFVLLPDGSFAPLPRVVSMDSYVGLSDAVAKAVANEMVSGDPEPCFPRLFPEDAQLASVTLTNGICTVDFPSSFPNHFDPPAELNQALAGLRYALLNVSGVESVRFTVGGEVYG